RQHILQRLQQGTVTVPRNRHDHHVPGLGRARVVHAADRQALAQLGGNRLGPLRAPRTENHLVPSHREPARQAAALITRATQHGNRQARDVRKIVRRTLRCHNHDHVNRGVGRGTPPPVYPRSPLVPLAVLFLPLLVALAGPLQRRLSGRPVRVRAEPVLRRTARAALHLPRLQRIPPLVLPVLRGGKDIPAPFTEHGLLPSVADYTRIP